MPRFSIASAIFEETETYPEYSFHLILDDGIPDILVNQVFLLKSRRDRKKNEPVREATSCLYQWINFANYLWDEKNVDYMNATSADILNFFYFLSVEKGLRNRNIISYITTIAKVYENLAIKNCPLDKSLFLPLPEMAICGGLRNNHRSITYISKMKNLLPRDNSQTCSMPSYCKWYTSAQIDALHKNLRLDYACIFLITVYTGMRISSALSLHLDSFDARKRTLSERRSKTGQVHICIIPQSLVNMLTTYILEVRSMYISTSEFLFIQKDGSPVSYNAYRKALSVAAERAGFNEPVHTHAGRSTFLANLRSYQLRERRLGHETFSDADICLLMDWSSLNCLYNYDLLTRIQEVSPMMDMLQKEIYSVAQAQTTFSAGGD